MFPDKYLGWNSIAKTCLFRTTSGGSSMFVWSFAEDLQQTCFSGRNIDGQVGNYKAPPTAVSTYN